MDRASSATSPPSSSCLRYDLDLRLDFEGEGFGDPVLRAGKGAILSWVKSILAARPKRFKLGNVEWIDLSGMDGVVGRGTMNVDEDGRKGKNVAATARRLEASIGQSPVIEMLLVYNRCEVTQQILTLLSLRQRKGAILKRVSQRYAGVIREDSTGQTDRKLSCSHVLSRPDDTVCQGLCGPS